MSVSLVSALVSQLVLVYVSLSVSGVRDCSPWWRYVSVSMSGGFWHFFASGHWPSFFSFSNKNNNDDDDDPINGLPQRATKALLDLPNNRHWSLSIMIWSTFRAILLFFCADCSGVQEELLSHVVANH